MLVKNDISIDIIINRMLIIHLLFIIKFFLQDTTIQNPKIFTVFDEILTLFRMNL